MKTTPYLEKVHTWVADKVKELPAPAAGAVVALVQVLEQEPGVVLVPGQPIRDEHCDQPITVHLSSSAL